MEKNKNLYSKIIKITALVLAFILLVKTFLCFLLSFAILEEPKDWPQRLKDDCHPKWYSWFSLILNTVGVVVYSDMYFGILNTTKFNLLVGLIGVTAYLIASVTAHIVLWIEHSKPHTMMQLNWMGTALSVVCSPLSFTFTIEELLPMSECKKWRNANHQKVSRAEQCMKLFK